ncbi:thiamine pyrophosphate-dependent dehydrogenase E1 component subunit alpha [Yimella sp. cx-51]|uniref:thiamine pyrophosphate-dependent dehydrogenase E1 component subunit alpha n=1 Tax=Yimella sp. cx-51 TaxID=2770551 RepID=UPI00165E6AE6|nr:thiamine pyrophosphate-dependent dehydrogenase E1 component subunit alpha [Yimella sp. cx-51]MBC9955637.1 thiamine pyrophosphate-dependent dehydrogenase E1 component subunit alpha [Yimella sp. cx-51]QTH37791.1 thiamine pyrophosphate-dependent dehydrogenase E1 component subunit alpha [Yimella sp. cx-51]
MQTTTQDVAVEAFLPSPRPVQLIDPTGAEVTQEGTRRPYAMPTADRLQDVWRHMVLGRRFDLQATALTKQGRLAVYPSSRGQEACQVGVMRSLTTRDWVFPTYRESMALVTRGIDPVEVLTLLRGSAHCGYDPMKHRTAAQCTPLATQLVHAAGTADGLRRRGEDSVALGFIGDGATSEGDFHEALNFAAVFDAPAIFFVQNNKYAISVPLSKQTKAPSLAYKAVGYGMACEQVDGNDPAAVLAVMDAALRHCRGGSGPFLIEAHTYRMDAHTNADDASRYRSGDEVTAWLDRDPIARLEAYLRARGLLNDDQANAVRQEAEALATDLRDRMNVDPQVDPMSLFDNVFSQSTPQVEQARAMVRAELDADQEEGR